MRASRLLSILILLQTRGRMTAAALAREFEVSPRTILRDIDELSAAGVPVYAEQGRDGGFELHEGYRTKLTGLTTAEAETVLLAGLGAAAADLGIAPTLAAAQLKLTASLPAEAGARAQEISERIHLDPQDWYRRADDHPHLPALAGAVWRSQRVLMVYESWSGVVERRLEPLGLVLKAGAWYAVAAVDGAPRTYRVSNIRELTVLDETFKRPKKFNLARHWRASLEEFEARLLKEEAVIRISPNGRKRLREISFAASNAVENEHRAIGNSTWVTARIPIESIEHAAGQLLRLHEEVEVLKPAALRKRIERKALAIAKVYRSKSR